MTDEIEALAERMYTQRIAERGPAWALLGHVTQELWRGYARAELLSEFA